MILVQVIEQVQRWCRAGNNCAGAGGAEVLYRGTGIEVQKNRGACAVMQRYKVQVLLQ